MRECREDGKGWRIDDRGFWWPCGPIGPILTREEYREKQAREAEDAEKETEA